LFPAPSRLSLYYIGEKGGKRYIAIIYVLALL